MEVINSGITTPKGAQLVLANLDFKLLEDNRLKTNLVFHISGNSNSKITVVYTGAIEPLIQDNEKYFILPSGEYNIREEIKGFKRPPCDMLNGGINYTFNLSASKLQEYEGLEYFIGTTLPGMFTHGILRRHREHNSTMWLYALQKEEQGNNEMNFGNLVLCVDNNKGLYYQNRTISGIEVLTLSIIDKLKKLRSDDKVTKSMEKVTI